MLNQYTFLELKRASKQKYKDGLKMAVIGDFATQHLAVAIKGYSQKEGRPLQVLDCDYDQFDAQILDEYSDTYKYLQTATFCGQQGRISRTVRAILSGQPGISAGQRVLRPTDQYYSLFQKKAMLSQSVQ